MFENIEQLEQQVKEFQKNILASTALLKSLEALTTTVKQQQASYDQGVKTLLDNMEQDRVASNEQVSEMTSTVRKFAANVTEDIGRNNNRLLSDFQRSIEEYDTTVKGLLEGLAKDKVALNKQAETILANIEKHAQSIPESVARENSTLVDQVRQSISDYDVTVKGLLEKLTEDRLALNKQVETILANIEKQAQSIPEGVARENGVLIEQIRQNINDYDRLLKASLEQIKLDNKTISDDAIKAYSELNKAHIEQLEGASSHIKEMIEQLELRYNQFLERLEATNIDQLFAEVQKMKKSLETKMTLILAGVGITAIIALVSLFVK